MGVNIAVRFPKSENVVKCYQPLAPFCPMTHSIKFGHEEVTGATGFSGVLKQHSVMKLFCQYSAILLMAGCVFFKFFVRVHFEEMYSLVSSRKAIFESLLLVWL